MATPEILLTEEQRLEFTQIPQNISEWEIARHYTLNENDIEIINRHRRDYNRLGFAVQYANSLKLSKQKYFMHTYAIFFVILFHPLAFFLHFVLL
ncbi:DUF4158 domain-containing protein [Clostridium sp. YIM B02506]|uniref:DUF4158 domain-containing protein n=1 Tax=Clostridium sp. YIM B02506 TaxID=2910680 RepID=UPI001EEEEAEB|nr:DUF4158 domain-containing protein [Clostridium sp. YIM B02506]